MTVSTALEVLGTFALMLHSVPCLIDEHLLSPVRRFPGKHRLTHSYVAVTPAMLFAE